MQLLLHLNWTDGLTVSDNFCRMQGMLACLLAIACQELTQQAHNTGLKSNACLRASLTFDSDNRCAALRRHSGGRIAVAAGGGGRRCLYVSET